jgi:hypothetical protein
MDLNVVANWLKGEWGVITQAPIAFLASVLVVAFVIWKIVQREFANRLANADSKYELARARVEDYERKLQGASPDEARAKVQALEARLQNLEPRRLSDEQIRQLSEVLRLGNLARQVQIDVASGSPDGAMLQDGLIRAFIDARWKVSVTYSVVGPLNALSRTGLRIGISHPANPDQQINAFAEKLREMGINSEFAQGPPLAVHIIISTRLA